MLTKLLLFVLFLFGVFTMLSSNFSVTNYSYVNPSSVTETASDAFTILLNASIPLTAVLLAVFYQTTGPSSIRVPVGLGILFFLLGLVLVYFTIGNTELAYTLLFLVVANVLLAYLVIFQLKKDPLALDRSKAIVATNLFLLVLASGAVAAVYFLNAAPYWLERLARAFSIASIVIFSLIFFNNPQGVDAFALVTFFLVAVPALSLG